MSQHDEMEPDTGPLGAVFEAKLVPLDKNASIQYIAVRVYDPKNIDGTDKCLDFLEKQFPFYQVVGLISGYAKVKK